jgi:DNA-binding response OmpR family regulator
VLDIGLPDIDGFEVLRRLRARRSAIGVLVLTRAMRSRIACTASISGPMTTHQALLRA